MKRKSSKSSKAHTPRPQRPGSLSWRLSQIRLPWYMVLVAFLSILLMGWTIARKQEPLIQQLRIHIEEARDLVYDKERQVLRLDEQVRMAVTDQFIASEARNKYGYLFPGEIRLVVTNPEVLGLPPRDDLGGGSLIEVSPP